MVTVAVPSEMVSAPFFAPKSATTFSLLAEALAFTVTVRWPPVCLAIAALAALSTELGVATSADAAEPSAADAPRATVLSASDRRGRRIRGRCMKRIHTT